MSLKESIITADLLESVRSFAFNDPKKSKKDDDSKVTAATKKVDPKASDLKEGFGKGTCTINKPGHKHHGKTAHIFHKFDDGRINAQVQGSSFRKGDVTNYTLKPGEYKLNEDTELEEATKKVEPKRKEWFDPTDMRDEKKQKAAYLNHLKGMEKINARKQRQEEASFDEDTDLQEALPNWAKEVFDDESKKSEGKKKGEHEGSISSRNDGHFPKQPPAAKGRKVTGTYGTAFDSDDGEDEDGNVVKKKQKIERNADGTAVRGRGRPKKETNPEANKYNFATLQDKSTKGTWFNPNVTLPKGKTRKVIATESVEGLKHNSDENATSDNAKIKAQVGKGEKQAQAETSPVDKNANKIDEVLGKDAKNHPGQITLEGVEMEVFKEGFTYSYEIYFGDTLVKEGVSVSESGVIASANRFMHQVLEECERTEGQVDRIKQIIRDTVK